MSSDDDHHVHPRHGEGLGDPRRHQDPVGSSLQRGRPATASGRLPPRPAAAAFPPSNNASPLRERHLVELLAKAAAEIRSEKDRVKRLEVENENLKARVRSSRLGAQSGTTTMADLKRQLESLANQTARQHEQLEHVTDQLRQAELRSHSRDPNLAKGQVHAASYHPPRAASAKPALGYAERLSPYAQQLRWTPSATTRESPKGVRGGSPTRSSAPQKAAGVAVPAANHRFDARESAATAHRNTIASPTRRALVVAADPEPPNRKPSPGTAPRRSASVDRAAMAAQATTNFNEVMMSRLRRAIAPPPTKEQLGEVVHAMVGELCKSLAKHGTRFPAQRLGPCVYQCGRRKLHLSVDSGRLVVKCGGGHVDLLEHIERNKLCVRADDDTA